MPDPGLEAAIQNYELAYLMQSAVPELTSLDGEGAGDRSGYFVSNEAGLLLMIGKPHRPAADVQASRRLVEGVATVVSELEAQYAAEEITTPQVQVGGGPAIAVADSTGCARCSKRPSPGPRRRSCHRRTAPSARAGRARSSPAR